MKNPDKSLKVIMLKKEIEHHFSIKLTTQVLSNDTFIYIITLNDITKEIKIKNRLKHLNEHLELKVNEKTKELQILNEDLENKVKIEVEKNRKKEQQLMEQSRYASLGEMLGNIAHQWRQPLSAISTTVSGMMVHKEMGIKSEKSDMEKYKDIMEYISFLSDTIEDFRTFFILDKNLIDFNINKHIQKAISITSNTYKSRQINLMFEETPNLEMSYGKPNELSQVILNIVNNSKDILKERKVEDKKVLIKLEGNKEENIIKILDNGGGISEDIIDKVFDPYFTTKHKSQGTGIGLYMSKEIIEKHFWGKLEVRNYKDNDYNGALFIITLPLLTEEEKIFMKNDIN